MRLTLTPDALEALINADNRTARLVVIDNTRFDVMAPHGPDEPGLLIESIKVDRNFDVYHITVWTDQRMIELVVDGNAQLTVWVES